MSPSARQQRVMAEGYALRWLARVGKARVGRNGQLQAGDELCLASPACILRLVERRAILVRQGYFVLAAHAEEAAA